MARDPELRAEAERLYVKAKLSIKEIAAALKVGKETIYKWRNDAAFDADTSWDEQRRKAMPVSIVAVQELYWNIIHDYLERMSKDSSLVIDAKAADAISKHVATINRIMPKKTLFSAIVSVLEEIKDYLAENDPELWTKFVVHLPAIRERLEKQVTEL